MVGSLDRAMSNPVLYWVAVVLLVGGCVAFVIGLLLWVLDWRR